MRPAYLLLCLSVLLDGFGAPARAADVRAASPGSDSSFSLGAFAGGHVFSEGTNLGVVGGEQNSDGARDGVLGGVRASVAVGHWFVAEAELAGLATEDRTYQRKARILGYRVNALAPLRVGNFRPFVLVGAGAMQVASSDAQGAAGLALDTKAEVHTGIGFDYRLLESVSVRGDARVLQVPGKENWGLTTDVEAMLGATVSFGGRRLSAQAARDSAVPPVIAAEPPTHALAPSEATLQVSTAEPVTAGPPAEVLPSGSVESPPAAIAPDALAVVAGVQTVSDLLERAREIRFESGTTKFTDSSLAFLDALAVALVNAPAVILEILVHTADSGDAKRDLSISRRRAEAIKYALVGKGVSVDQLLATGRGSEHPVAPNLTRTGRLRNERVEIHRISSPARGR